MKTLILVRHAKSSWKYDLTDHERPLKKRGRNEKKKKGGKKKKEMRREGGRGRRREGRGER